MRPCSAKEDARQPPGGMWILPPAAALTKARELRTWGIAVDQSQPRALNHVLSRLGRGCCWSAGRARDACKIKRRMTDQNEVLLKQRVDNLGIARCLTKFIH